MQGARSHEEMELYDQFYRHAGISPVGELTRRDPISTVVFVMARDGGSMLRDSHLNETVTLMDELAGKRFLLSGRWSFQEFCTDFCQLNEPITLFKVSLPLSLSPSYSRPSVEACGVFRTVCSC